ncbi:MAG: FxDxF family PEP-CTERM protein [Candidatus Contendobacter sp.]|nr:FxDxF family PEP-CTERM protein [Candidatus Contendobacter sp.]
MTVLDSAALKSYILDLNIQINDVLAKVGSGPTFSCKVGECFYQFSADTNMLSFLSTAAGPLVWAIGALDTNGATANNGHRYIATASNITQSTTPLNNLNLAKLGNANKMVGDANADIGVNTSLIITDPGRSAYAGSAQWGDNWGGNANFIATGKVGTSMDLYLLSQSSGAFAQRFQSSIYEGLAYEGEPVFAQLDMDGTLYIAAVPEPETYALMLAGLGLVGWMARRRKA